MTDTATELDINELIARANKAGSERISQARQALTTSLRIAPVDATRTMLAAVEAGAEDRARLDPYFMQVSQAIEGISRSAFDKEVLALEVFAYSLALAETLQGPTEERARQGYYDALAKSPRKEALERLERLAESQMVTRATAGRWTLLGEAFGELIAPEADAEAQRLAAPAGILLFCAAVARGVDALAGAVRVSD